MSELLPAGCSFVNDLEINTDELLDLFERVAHANDSPQTYGELETHSDSGADPTTPDDQIERAALGVRNAAGVLVSYAAATIDNRTEHATVDCMVVDPAEAGQGIGKAIVTEGMRGLDVHNARSISFQAFGQVGRLLPYLEKHERFSYDTLNNEYITYRMPGVSTPESLGLTDTPAAIEASPDDVRELEPITQAEMIAFKDRIIELVQASARHACRVGLDVAAYDSFMYEIGGRTIVVSKDDSLDNYQAWFVKEYDTAEFVASPHGIVMTVEKEYSVEQDANDDAPSGSMYRETQEIQGSDGAMRPFVPPKDETSPGFNHGRYKHIITTLNRLSPEHIVC